MLHAGEEDARDVQGDEPDGRVDEPLVELLDPLRAPERIGGHGEPGGRDAARS